MKEEEYILLIQKDLQGSLNDQDKNRLEQWKIEHPEHLEIAQTIERAWNVSDQFGHDIELDMDKDFEILQDKIRNTEITAKRDRRLIWFTVAASFILLFTFLFTFRTNIQKVEFTSPVDGFVYELPDGSTITLSEGSEIFYSSNFSEKRNLVMNGSVRFEVVADNSSPFTVVSKNFRTVVLGTIFLVNDEEHSSNPSVQLLEGSVRVTHFETNNDFVLEPNQRIGLSQEREFVISENLKLSDFDWLNRSVEFDNINLENAISKLENFYGVSIEIPHSIRECIITASFTNQDVTAVLEAVVTYYGASLRTTSEKSYMIEGGVCN